MTPLPRIMLKQDGEHWTAFDRVTGLKLTASPAGTGKLERSRAPELLDISVTDQCDIGCVFCAPAGTRIQTPDGDVPIELISAGQNVHSCDTTTRARVTDTVTQIQQRPYIGEMIVIETEDGHVLQLTPNHEVFTSRGWISAGNLTEEDELLEWRPV